MEKLSAYAFKQEICEPRTPEEILRCNGEWEKHHG